MTFSNIGRLSAFSSVFPFMISPNFGHLFLISVSILCPGLFTQSLLILYFFPEIVSYSIVSVE